MLALVANATQETDAGIVAALVGFWLWRHHRLGRTARKTARAAVCVAAVVVAGRVSPVLCVLVVGGVVGVWAAKGHGYRKRRRHHQAVGRIMQQIWKRSNRRRIRQPRRLSSFEAEYQRHMASTAWRHQRDRVLTRDRHRCVACGSRYLLNGHHTYYSSPVGREPDSAITTLCAPCHRTTHLRHELTRGAYHDYRQATRWVIDRQRERVA